MGFLSQINLVEILSSFIVLFVIIDVTGSIPIFLSLKSSDKNIKAGQACLVALLMFVAFFYAGDRLKKIGIEPVTSMITKSTMNELNISTKLICDKNSITLIVNLLNVNFLKVFHQCSKIL